MANEANNELADENAALESRLETMSKQNENKRKALAQLVRFVAYGIQIKKTHLSIFVTLLGINRKLKGKRSKNM